MSGHAYRGVHALHLSVAQTAKGYRDNRWATATEIQALGGQVRPGEQATPVLVDDEQAPPPPDAADTGQPTGGEQDHAPARPPLVRVDDVFHAEQADGLTLDRRNDDRDTGSELTAHAIAERLIYESGVDVRHVRGELAYYNLQQDRVTLPEREQFASANGYYQTALHELGHATGHPNRLDRDTLKQGAGKFGSVEYAREELRAEISAMLTGARVGGMASRKGTFWPREKGPPFLSCGGRRDVAGRSGATGGHVATSAIAVAPPVACGTRGCVWRP